MTNPLPYGLAPYISPEILQSAPTGIDWSTIPPTTDYDPQANNAEMWNMCMRATAQADGYCNQVLRATIDTELLHGPDYRVTVGPASGGSIGSPYWGSCQTNARLILSRWPVLEVTGVQVCPNGQWPRSWTSVATGYFEPEVPPIGIYGSAAPSAEAQGGQAILVGGSYINWSYGRNGWAVQVTYMNGWPHTALTATANAGATTIAVNDTTGWAIENFFNTYTGATGAIYDGGTQESIQVTAASTKSGPGTLTLSSALQYPHEPGAVVTCLPLSVQKACIFFAAAEALTRGATSTTIHSVGGSAQSSDAGAHALAMEAELLLHPFRRTI